MKYVKHVTPVLPRQARGITSIIYREAAHEMGRLPEPVAVFAPHPELLTAAWATLRESLAVGSAPRGFKEAVTATVAAGLRCPWCVDAHTTMLYATGHAAAADGLLQPTADAVDDPAAVYITWAKACTRPATASDAAVPFPADQRAEFIGTLVEFHFLARVVRVLLDETFLPGGPRLQRLIRRLAGRALAGKAQARHAPGRAADRLAEQPLPADMEWARGSAHIARLRRLSRRARPPGSSFPPGTPVGGRRGRAVDR